MKRFTLYRREKKPRNRPRKDWRTLPVASFVKAFLANTLIMASIAGILWLTGLFDFSSEHGPRKPTTCGFLFLFTPQHLQNTGLCIAYNLAPFALLPGFVLVMLCRRLLGGSRR